MPTALVTGSPDRVPDVAVALKSAGFDILAAGTLTPDDVPDLEEGSVDCYVQLPVDSPRPAGGALRGTRDVIAHEVVARFDSAARILPLLAPSATVLLVIEGPDVEDHDAGSPHPDRKAHRTLAGLLAEAIVEEGADRGVRTSVLSEGRVIDEIAGLAGPHPAEPRPWWVYADVDPDLGFADWRLSVLCLASVPPG